MRRIVNKDQAKVERAKALLEQDDSPASWKKVAARFSTEKATKDSGGLVEGVTAGQSEPALEEQIFSAPEGQLVGPFKGQAGYYLIQVEKITPAETTPLSEVTEQIGQQLGQAKQQQLGQDFQQDFIEKWRSRTFCADDYLIDRCDELHAPAPESSPGARPGDPDAAPSHPARHRVPRSADPGAAAGADFAPGARSQASSARRRRCPGRVPPGAVPPGGAPAPTPTP